ncbi:heavy metal translocating P-type ATPase [Mariniplasma anaerobium]|uniref:Copper-exporting P-type ATPase n=1 Tax=Mariniplasma anaerobium TaxID=2735436 RepID=A0A7R7ZG93_9MOLU|nr:heavy metal translocating P-type ATPase [Mariniplasma anaerobium]BCR35814.1 copper-translocating P-type ATPase [Mariniplasma anaerobium]
MKTEKFDIIGMTCATCANSIDHVLKDQKGIIKGNVNLANDTAIIEFDESVISIQGVIETIESAGFDASLKKENIRKLTLTIQGMTCATCAGNVDHAVKNLEGVKSVNVNIANDKMTVEFDADVLKLSQIKKTIQDIGYDALLDEEIDKTVDPDVIKMQKAKKKMLTSASLTAVIMTLMIIHMFIVPIPGYTIITATLAFPVVFILGAHVHKTSFKSLKSGRPNMDVLVSLGSLPPYLIGLLGLFLPITTFIEMASTIMTFHLIGKFLETRAKGKASEAIKKLIELGAKTASIIVDGQEIEVLTSELSVKDIMVIRPGAKIPTDGIIVQGQSLIDESLATGESMPVKRGVGDPVIGATINKQGLLKVEVTKTGNDTFLAQIIDLVEACQGSKVPIQAFADKITGYFVPAIMVITVLTFISFNVFPEFHLSILRTFEGILPWINTDQSTLTLSFVTATAVLVIACSCALGLGTPTALMVGSGIGAQKGILIRNGESVQTLKDIKVIAFDKTGTLTYGKPVVTDIKSDDDLNLLSIAASLEVGSEHVLASAIVEEAKTRDIKLKDVKHFEALTSKGIKGSINDTMYYIGNRRLSDELNLDYKAYEEDMVKLEEQAKTVMIVSSDKSVLGIIAVADALKDEVAAVIKAIESMGIKTAMITGDNERTAKAIAKKAGITHVISNVLPTGKVDEIKKLQETYGLVAMVGDGINDAPALKQANVGIAIGTGTDVAIEAADVTLVRGQLASILQAVELSKAIFRKIKQNYFWAWFYNAVAIPFAVFGLLHPMIGAAAMSMSSLNVIYNSLRLKKVDLNKHLEVSYEA